MSNDKENAAEASSDSSNVENQDEAQRRLQRMNKRHQAILSEDDRYLGVDGLGIASDDAVSDLEAHIYALGQTVIHTMADGMTPQEAITVVSNKSGETFEFVRSAAIDALNEAIGRHK